MGLFSTTGIRGIVNERFTPEFASELATVFSLLMKREGSKEMYVCRDVRTGAEMILQSSLAGIISAGLDAYDCGIAPLPAMTRWCRVRKVPGIIVTSSHNPPEYIGMKFILPDSLEITGRKQEEMERVFLEKKYKRPDWRGLGKLKRCDELIDAYRMMLKKAAGNGIKPLHVVVDCGNGAQAVVFPQLLRELGCRVTTLDAQIDGFFPGRLSEPRPETLVKLSKVVPALGADLGVGFDGDGDRSIFVDEKGTIHLGDISAGIIARRIFSSRKGSRVVTTVSASSLIDDLAKKYGGKVLKTEVGAPPVIRTMLEKKADFSFEENGGCIFPEFNYAREGGLTAVMLLCIMSEEKKKFSRLASELPKYHSLKLKVRCPESDKDRILAELREEYRGNVDTTDGVKIFLKEGWVLIRPSHTEELYRVFVETKSERKTRELADKFIKIVEKKVRGK